MAYTNLTMIWHDGRTTPKSFNRHVERELDRLESHNVDLAEWFLNFEASDFIKAIVLKHIAKRIELTGYLAKLKERNDKRFIENVWYYPAILDHL